MMMLPRLGGLSPRAWVRRAAARRKIKAMALEWFKGQDEATIDPSWLYWSAARARADGARDFQMLFAGSAPFEGWGDRSFRGRLSLALGHAGWELSADEALDQRHPALSMAFAKRINSGPFLAEPLRSEELDRLAEQIARRLFGESSEAPAAEWLDGFLEEPGERSSWEGLRLATLARLEAKALGKSLGAKGASASAPRRAAL